MCLRSANRCADWTVVQSSREADEGSEQLLLPMLRGTNGQCVPANPAQVLRNMVAVMRLLAVSKAAPASAGLNLLLTQRREQGIRVAEAHLSHQQASPSALHRMVHALDSFCTASSAHWQS